MRNARIEKGYTQVEIATKINISTRAYQYLEYGEINPKLKTAIDIAQVLNSTVEDLFGLTSRQTKNTNKSSNKNLQNNNSIKKETKTNG